MQQKSQHLVTIFQDQTYAWQLLNAEIQIQMSSTVQGETIAFLLQLYMGGVEKMNSLADKRESYFKNKVTSLMTKQSVIRSLKDNPMKKKPKPGELQPIKQQTKTKKLQQKTQGSSQMVQVKKKQQQKPDINHFELKQKRRQLQMRMAYVAEQHGPQNLKKIIAQQDNRQQNITKKITSIINSHQQRLNQRIKARKLKTATFRSRSQINAQQNPFVQFGEYEKEQQTKLVMMENLDPFQRLLLHDFGKKIQDKDKTKDELRKTIRKKHKSLQIEGNMQSPDKRTRKYTHDQINPKHSFS